MTASQRLDEWRSWARHWMPDLWYSINPCYALMGRDDNEAWGEVVELPEELRANWTPGGSDDERPLPVDERRAEETDRLVLVLPRAHRNVLKLHYIKGRPQAELDLGAAQRALQDLIDNPSWTRMRLYKIWGQR